MPQLPSDLPEAVPAEVAAAFQAHPGLLETCGKPLQATASRGLSNRVFRLEAERGTFYLRLPLKQQAVRVDRVAEAHNLALAARLCLAVPPLYCDVEDAILLTRAVAVADPPPPTLPERLGTALGKLHASAEPFKGELDPGAVNREQLSRLPQEGVLSAEWQDLARALSALETQECEQTALLVPSHGDVSPGNCLLSADGFWLIDWEFSAMAPPAWDLAYAILEHDFCERSEMVFMESYCAEGAGHLRPSTRELDVMKARCDAVSAFWALEQLVAGRDETVFLPFARERRDRLLCRVKRVFGHFD
ncbi:phosphotransferase [Labrenzia sp. VG12]|uniref:phosphotransferase n=1 Tax=Labrenzia sp. VG12 TaxID=2021862 RepID=UPI0012FD14CF|nr:phosphotransferase [Labrenzia sp. VG12]